MARQGNKLKWLGLAIIAGLAGWFLFRPIVPPSRAVTFTVYPMGGEQEAGDKYRVGTSNISNRTLLYHGGRGGSVLFTATQTNGGWRVNYGEHRIGVGPALLEPHSFISAAVEVPHQTAVFKVGLEFTPLSWRGRLAVGIPASVQRVFEPIAIALLKLDGYQHPNTEWSEVYSREALEYPGEMESTAVPSLSLDEKQVRLHSIAETKRRLLAFVEVVRRTIGEECELVGWKSLTNGMIVAINSDAFLNAVAEFTGSQLDEGSKTNILDSWHNPVELTLRFGKYATNEAGVVQAHIFARAKSFGRNCRDDHGSDDDIVVEEEVMIPKLVFAGAGSASDSPVFIRIAK